MKALALLTAMLAAAPAFAAVPAALPVAEDNLMIQIHAKQLTQANGGITAAVAVKGATKGINLELVDPLAPLAPAEGLVERAADAAPAKRKAKPAKRAVEQGENLEAAGQQASFDKAAK